MRTWERKGLEGEEEAAERAGHAEHTGHAGCVEHALENRSCWPCTIGYRRR
jgi:hypothetical protein